jgi:hypothetical protein
VRRVIAVTVVAAIFTATAVAAGPPAVLFKTGYNLCRAAPLAAIRAAGGQTYKRGFFANKSCLWERPDLQAGVLLSAHPRGPGVVLMRQMLEQSGTNGLRARRIRIAGAQNGVVVVLPRSLSQTVAKDLFAAYPQGVVQLNMTAPGEVRDSRLLAVLRVVNRR